ncbi:uracil-DNA glycosylase, partial [Salmonella sp. s51228]|uniref:uracil-DNA glycosylase n=1 Tax=Salmonella sp. s51228 TaxID=3159652 RepID=UPI003980A0FB
NSEYSSGKEIFPPTELIFNIFNLISPDQVKVVILGQDPYHGVGQAHGFCFSVPKAITMPPSLKNIFKELETDIPDFETPSHGCLDKWAKQGVFLLNASLTVQAHKANSHAKCGW